MDGQSIHDDVILNLLVPSATQILIYGIIERTPIIFRLAILRPQGSRCAGSDKGFSNTRLIIIRNQFRQPIEAVISVSSGSNE